MSKNAMVLDDHFGDDGAVTAGMILKDITTKRFDALVKLGLVRAATDDEVKAGDQHVIEPDESRASQSSDVPAAITQVRREVEQQAQAFIDELKARHERALLAAQETAETALLAQQKESDDMKSRLEEAVAAQILRAETAEAALAAAKAQPAASNKKAAEPANKGA